MIDVASDRRREEKCCRVVSIGILRTKMPLDEPGERERKRTSFGVHSYQLNNGFRRSICYIFLFHLSTQTEHFPFLSLSLSSICRENFVPTKNNNNNKTSRSWRNLVAVVFFSRSCRFQRCPFVLEIGSNVRWNDFLLLDRMNIDLRDPNSIHLQVKISLALGRSVCWFVRSIGRSIDRIGTSNISNDHRHSPLSLSCVQIASVRSISADEDEDDDETMRRTTGRWGFDRVMKRVE